MPAKTLESEVKIVTLQDIESWKMPSFQRPFVNNTKVKAISKEIATNGHEIPGWIILGKLGDDTYLLDAQHRVNAAKMSGISEFLAKVELIQFDSMAEMGQHFIRENSKIVSLKPDDILRGLRDQSDVLQLLESCPVIAYDNVRRGGGINTRPMVTMSNALRAWDASRGEVPGGSVSAIEALNGMSISDAQHLVEFLNLAKECWGTDSTYNALWNRTNLVMCMWIYKLMVIGINRLDKSRFTKMSREDFQKGLIGLTDNTYSQFVIGKNNITNFRVPLYNRMKKIFLERLGTLKFPAPDWVSGK